MKNFKPTYNNNNYSFYHCNGKDLPPYPTEVPIAEVNIYCHNSCMVINHNFPCPVCKTKPAVCDTHGMIMNPCWSCQDKGYKLTFKKKDGRPLWKRILF